VVVVPVVAYRYFRTGDLGMFIKGGFLKVSQHLATRPTKPA
jgi:hypothetical protein